MAKALLTSEFHCSEVSTTRLSQSCLSKMVSTLKGNEDIGAKKRDAETERAGRSPKSSPRIFSSRLHYPPRGHQVDASFIVIDGQRSDKLCYSFPAKYL